LFGQGCSALEANTKQSLKVRLWRSSGVFKPWHVCRETSGTWEIPCRSSLSMGNRGRKAEPNGKANDAGGKSDQLIVLWVWESHIRGEGVGSYMQLSKETYTEHCRLG